MHFLQAINSDLSVLIVCNKTGGTIKGDIKKNTPNTMHKNEDQISQIYNQSVCKSCSQSLVNSFVSCVFGKKQEYLIVEASFISIFQRIYKDIFINCSPF